MADCEINSSKLTVSVASLQMPTGCCVPGCGSRGSGYKFPDDPGQRTQWINAINRINIFTGKLWHPSNTSIVCGRHFKPDDYNTILPDERKPLKPGALPTLFLSNPGKLYNRLPLGKQLNKQTFLDGKEKKDQLGGRKRLKPYSLRALLTSNGGIQYVRRVVKKKRKLDLPIILDAEGEIEECDKTGNQMDISDVEETVPPQPLTVIPKAGLESGQIVVQLEMNGVHKTLLVCGDQQMDFSHSESIPNVDCDAVRIPTHDVNDVTDSLYLVSADRSRDQPVTFNQSQDITSDSVNQSCRGVQHISQSGQASSLANSCHLQLDDFIEAQTKRPLRTIGNRANSSVSGMRSLLNGKGYLQLNKSNKAHAESQSLLKFTDLSDFGKHFVKMKLCDLNSSRNFQKDATISITVQETASDARLRTESAFDSNGSNMDTESLLEANRRSTQIESALIASASKTNTASSLETDVSNTQTETVLDTNSSNSRKTAACESCSLTRSRNPDADNGKTENNQIEKRSTTSQTCGLRESCTPEMAIYRYISPFPRTPPGFINDHTYSKRKSTYSHAKRKRALVASTSETNTESILETNASNTHRETALETSSSNNRKTPSLTCSNACSNTADADIGEADKNTTDTSSRTSQTLSNGERSKFRYIHPGFCPLSWQDSTVDHSYSLGKGIMSEYPGQSELPCLLTNKVSDHSYTGNVVMYRGNDEGERGKFYNSSRYEIQHRLTEDMDDHSYALKEVPLYCCLGCDRHFINLYYALKHVHE